MKWEYNVTEKLTDLTKLGLQGWEAYAVLVLGTVTIHLLKRPLTT